MMWSKSRGVTPAMRNAFSPARCVASLNVRSRIWVSMTCSVASPTPRTYTGFLAQSLARSARVSTTAPRAHTDARAARLAVRDDRDVAEAVVEGGQRVPDLDDEGAPAHGSAIHIARSDAERLAEQRGRVLAGGEDAVHVGDLEPGVADGVGDRLEVERELALPGEVADLVALVRADDADRIGERFQISHGGHRTGSNSGSVAPSVSFENTTRTGMSHVMAWGSGSMLTRFDIRRGPSASSTMAST